MLAAEALDESQDIETRHRRLGDVYRRWADNAEKELVECTVGGQATPKLGLRGREPVLVWRSILPERAPKGQEGELVRWRNVANAALELQRLSMDRRAVIRLLRRDVGDDGHVADGAHEDAIDGGGAHGDDEGSRPRAGRDDGGDGDRWRVDPRVLHLQIEEARKNVEAIRDEATVAAEQCQDGNAAQVNLAQEILDALVRMQNGDGCGREFMRKVTDMRGRAAQHLDEAANTTRKRHLEAWTDWIRLGIDTGARNAHKYTKLPRMWMPPSMVTPDGVVSAHPARIIEAYRDKYI